VLEFNPSWEKEGERERIFKQRYDRTTETHDEAEFSVARDRGPIDVRANVTKPFLSWGKRGEIRDDALNVPPVHPLLPSSSGSAGGKIPFPPARPRFLPSVCVHPPKRRQSGEDSSLCTRVNGGFLSVVSRLLSYRYVLCVFYTQPCAKSHGL